MELEQSACGDIHTFRIASKNENAGSMAGVSGGGINGLRVSLASF